LTRTRKTKRCPLVAHYAAPNGCCIGCGKSYQKNPRKPARKARNVNPRKRSNPATAPGVKRIGRAQKLFYLRDQGRVPGPNVKTYTRRADGVWTYPPGWAFFPNKVAVIR